MKFHRKSFETNRQLYTDNRWDKEMKRLPVKVVKSYSLLFKTAMWFKNMVLTFTLKYITFNHKLKIGYFSLKHNLVPCNNTLVHMVLIFISWVRCFLWYTILGMVTEDVNLLHVVVIYTGFTFIWVNVFFLLSTIFMARRLSESKPLKV